MHEEAAPGGPSGLGDGVLVVDRERVVRQARFPVTDIPGTVREALAVVRRVAAER
ncbi:hypothetical protein [Streptomyces sp. NBC_01615]|uniref:hypothetical protein n=1 Tax=Streptomyces sp. NBC_01615 TaxID=2975898 RepID=UPI00386454F7